MPPLLNILGLGALTGIPLFFAICGVATIVDTTLSLMFDEKSINTDEEANFTYAAKMISSNFMWFCVRLLIVPIAAYMLSVPMVPFVPSQSDSLLEIIADSGLTVAGLVYSAFPNLIPGPSSNPETEDNDASLVGDSPASPKELNPDHPNQALLNISDTAISRYVQDNPASSATSAS